MPGLYRLDRRALAGSLRRTDTDFRSEPSEIDNACMAEPSIPDPERNLERLLDGLEPELLPDTFVFVPSPRDAPVPGAKVLASVLEPEGLSIVVSQQDADDLGLEYEFVAAWIVLRVHSALDAVGLTAAVSSRLAEDGISCNVIAGLRHDHLLVPVDRARDALQALA
jgi:hypothetical protein